MREQVLAVVERCIADLSSQLPEGEALAATSETILVGEGGSLDSLALVNLIVNIEEQLSVELGLNVGLVDLALTSEAETPLRTVGSLVDHVVSAQ